MLCKKLSKKHKIWGKDICKKEFFFLFFLFPLTFINAQEANSTAGGSSTGSGGVISYSVGQVVYTTNVGSSGSVIQGVQQPYEISIINTLEEAKDIILQCDVYPNPTTDYLILQVESYTLSGLSYSLYDIKGNLIEDKQIKVNKTKVVVTNLLPAIYFLKISNGNRVIKSFKIVKN